ncbi:MAG TPA: PhzF family phenazine biosynthesis protein [Telluria sp.]|nr:PhzF family phenazine biosynthesis protein [Telluria sp.]
MRIQEWKCFGLQAGQGNAALVVYDAPADTDWRLAFAAERRKPACVFLDQDAHGWRLDYYYPHKRSPLCMHASLAAAAELAIEGPLTVHTAWHGQPLTLSREGDIAYVRAASTEVATPPVPLDTLRDLLRAPALEPVAPPRAASVGSPKLLVQVPDRTALNALAPDLAAIGAWSAAHGINGIYAYCARPDGAFEGRNFNHLDPALEDSATGVAAGALTALLGRPLRLHQGAAVDNPCLLLTQLDGKEILIGGRVSMSA